MNSTVKHRENFQIQQYTKRTQGINAILTELLLTFQVFRKVYTMLPSKYPYVYHVFDIQRTMHHDIFL